MNITIVGAGNIGTQMAVHSAQKGHSVIIFGSKPSMICNELTIVNEKDEIIHRGEIHKATSDAREAFEKAELIMVTVPSFMMKDIAELVETYARDGMFICILPGTGGGECAFKNCINKGAVVCGLQRVPSVARLTEYGKTVRAVGYRDELHVAAIPSTRTNDCCRLIEDILDMPCIALPNYLNITLTPSNPILHSVRLKNLFGDYHEGMVYSDVPLFYEEWNDDTSEELLACDYEVQRICATLKEFDLHYVRSLKDHYESYTVSSMTDKIKSIQGFKGLKSPVKECGTGVIPDFDSRYFTADFPYGLIILIQIAEYAKVAVPHMKDKWEWYSATCNPDNIFSYSDYGIKTYEEFREFYLN